MQENTISKELELAEEFELEEELEIEEIEEQDLPFVSGYSCDIET